MEISERDRAERGTDTIPVLNTAKTASNIRNHNERALLTALRSQGPMAGVQLAKYLGVSAQTASVLTRVLEHEGLVQRGRPIRGKVGKPLHPVELRADGAFALGLRIGRRGADLLLMDLVGNRRLHFSVDYQFPAPADIEAFVSDGLRRVEETLGAARFQDLVGLGIASPFELWNWLDGLGAPKEKADEWRHYDFKAAMKTLTGLDVFWANDVNMACNGEATFGAGTQHRSFIYFYVGSFLGGGIVLDKRVFYGSRGNAAAFGSLPYGAFGADHGQLLHHASVYLLEQRLRQETGEPINLRANPEQWQIHEAIVDQWLTATAEALAIGATTVCAVLDISTVLVDGSFPPAIRSKLLGKIEQAMVSIDTQGLSDIAFEEGRLGRDAGSLGAAYQPLLSGLFLEGSQLG